jgi:hypothetical protein
LISAEEANSLDDRQSLNLIFLPGFSTAEKVSDVSGRGVGMDVVRTNITKLNGTIDVHSEVGRGTNFIISLPLTLVILPVLLSRKCAKVRTLLFLPRRVLLTTVVSDRRDFPDCDRDPLCHSAAITGRTPRVGQFRLPAVSGSAPH